MNWAEQESVWRRWKDIWTTWNSISRAEPPIPFVWPNAANISNKNCKKYPSASSDPRKAQLSRFQHVSLSQEYELQLSNMNRSVQRSEEIIKKLQMDKQSYSTELSNVRDLNETMEKKKEQIIRQLTSREIENEQLQAMLGDMKVEIDLLRTQIHNEKSMVQSLEEIIGSLREKDFQTEIHVQERNSDLQLAKDRANLGDMKL